MDRDISGCGAGVPWLLGSRVVAEAKRKLQVGHAEENWFKSGFDG